jgi:hypothetical protein
MPIVVFNKNTIVILIYCLFNFFCSCSSHILLPLREKWKVSNSRSIVSIITNAFFDLSQQKCLLFFSSKKQQRTEWCSLLVYQGCQSHIILIKYLQKKMDRFRHMYVKYALTFICSLNTLKSCLTISL